MSPADGRITHVSDTALMVAACRALEFDAPDGFVRDPFAGRLAGERGMAILEATPRPEIMRFGIAVRSRFIDELLLDALAGGRIATVLSVGCGLDARPWRLELPPELRWIEVDFAEMLDYKDALMAGETPHCRRERLVADVTDPAQRQAIFAAAGSEPSLMITEGLLMYLPAGSVEALAAEARRATGIEQWISDIMTAAFGRAIQLDRNRPVQNVQAPDALMGDQILEVVQRNGWATEARRSYITDTGFAQERARKVMGECPQAPPPEFLSDPTGVHRFTRA
jgi:methyltransferase (TIGR00027 family)